MSLPQELYLFFSLFPPSTNHYAYKTSPALGVGNMASMACPAPEHSLCVACYVSLCFSILVGVFSIYFRGPDLSCPYRPHANE